MTRKEKILYQYPPKLAKNSEIPYAVKPLLRENDEFQIVAKLPNENISTITLQVPCFINPKQLLEQIILKKQSKLKNYRGKIDDYILKICGQEVSSEIFKSLENATKCLNILAFDSRRSTFSETILSYSFSTYKTDCRGVRHRLWS